MHVRQKGFAPLERGFPPFPIFAIGRVTFKQYSNYERVYMKEYKLGKNKGPNIISYA